MTSEYKQHISYLPLALKYRPKKFSDLKGQEILAKTLSAAILHSRINPAYLLTGIRGIGKTTSARIIASLVNCENVKFNNNLAESCGKCKNCIAVENGNHPDIIEIDAASKTSIDDIRIIIDSSEYRALLGKFKIFIIDEVHMISKNAFNALLKTLEEPPANVMFIFATTEVNKIPLTILSRCQRFDLRRFKSEEILDLLSSISDNENIVGDIEALKIIALKSGGSARDAISMLDQAWMLSETNNDKKISIELVRNMLGISSLDIVFEMISNIIEGKSDNALHLINQIYSNGTDLIYFFENILDVVGYIIKVSTIENYSEKEFEAYSSLINTITGKFNLGMLTILWQLIFKSLTELKVSHNQILASEILIIKLVFALGLPDPYKLDKTLPRQ